MPRVLVLCLALLAAFQPPLAAAAPVSVNVALSASTVAFAESVGLTSDHPAQFVAELVRLLYMQADAARSPIVPELRAQGGSDATGDRVVPVPLSADVWGRAVFRHRVAADDLLSAILLDRRAALLCHALAALDDQTLTFLAEHPAVLTDLYDHAAPSFATFGASFRIRAERVAVPGGELAVPLWESVVGERVDRPERFVHALYGDNDGRVAYLYDTIAELDGPHAAFALGAWIPSAAVRAERFAALAAAAIHGYREWRARERPFSRPLSDFAIVMTRLQVRPDGAPAPPAARLFWNAVFEIRDSPSPALAARDAAEHGLIDGAFLAEATGVSDMYARSDRVDQLSFAQRVFSSLPDAESGDAGRVLRALPRQRMLIWALERMGVKRPSAYVAVSRQARVATSGDPNHVFWTLAQLQGSLALIARARMVGTVDQTTAERLALSVSAVPLVDGKYQGGIAQWIERDLLPALPAAPGAEARLVAALSGRTNDPADPRIVWEGQQYRLDFAAAESRRLRAVREKQGGYSLDLALDLARLARSAASANDRERETTSHALAALAQNVAPRSKSAQQDMMPPGVSAPGPLRERLDRTIGELARVDEVREPGRAARVATPLVEMADTALSEALLTLVYAIDIGDPEGAALLASNVAMRHDFGFGQHDGELRMRRPWDVPRQDFLPDVPWHVTGSLLGLDIALAPMTLRHINLDRSADAPRLQSTEREAFAVGTALMDERLLRDSDRDAIVAAIDRGRQRVRVLPATPEEADLVADAVRLDGWRRRALSWTLQNRPSDIPSMFSLAELMALGGGAPGADLDAWGTSAFSSAGCACTRMIAPGGWRLLAGRAQLAFMSFVVSDLNLRVATVLGELGLPAALERPVLAAAVEDFIDEAAPTDASDWFTLAHLAQALTRQRIEDYVAAAAAVDGPLVPVDDAGSASVP